jgi:hypothetical protein
MKLVSVEVARAVWLFDLQELNPHGKVLTPILKEIAARYKFAKFPNDVLDVVSDKDKSLLFEAGEFTKGHEDPIFVVSLKIYDDGIVVETRSSTDDASMLADDLLTWAAKEFALVRPPKIKKLFLSTIVVQTDKALGALSPAMEAFARKLSAIVKNADGEPIQYSFDVAQFWPLMLGVPGSSAGFRLERKVGTKPSDGKYFSEAPLQTREHEAALRDLFGN